MKRLMPMLLPLLILQGCSHPPINLLAARKGFVTHISPKQNDYYTDLLPTPPSDQLKLVSYPSAVGPLAAYLSLPPKDGKKHAAIIWIIGGDFNSLDDTPWRLQPASDDQSARAFREAGIITMYPSFRGGNQNPGYKEGFYGEVNDVLSAEAYLAKQPDVDPNRIYLGGHSTGGTMAMLTAESTSCFRAVFSLGPVTLINLYPKEYLPFDTSNEKEVELRSPRFYINAVHRPLYVMEGTDSPSNLKSLNYLKQINKNPEIHTIPMDGYDHFSEVLPATELIAQKILADTGPQTDIFITESEFANQHLIKNSGVS